MYLCVWASDLDSDIVYLQRDNVSYIIDWYGENPIPKYNQALQKVPFFPDRPWPVYTKGLNTVEWKTPAPPPQKKHAEQLKKTPTSQVFLRISGD